MRPVVVGVIVAAGESTRMGFPKQLLPIGDRPMLQWVVDAAEASTLDRVVEHLINPPWLGCHYSMTHNATPPVARIGH